MNPTPIHCHRTSYPDLMTEPEQKLTPATPDDLAESLSCALRFEGHKSQHDSDRLNADTVATAGVVKGRR
jgi:hypothetical protein